jgi:phenylacetate-coenzyme A ligase PaaK-like adenylate-forming protein
MATSLLLPQVLWLRRRLRRLRRHERWNQAQLSAHQQRATAGLRQFAYERSPFYRRFHHGLESAPVVELPVLTKAVLMDTSTRSAPTRRYG